MPRIRQFHFVQRPVFALWLLLCFTGLRILSAQLDSRDDSPANDCTENVLEQRADETHPGNLTAPQGAKDFLDGVLPDFADDALDAVAFLSASLPAFHGSGLLCRVMNRGPPDSAV